MKVFTYPWPTKALFLALMATTLRTSSAQILNPPPFPIGVVTFPERDFVSLDNLKPLADVEVQLRRANVVMSRARGRTDPTGFIEVNHPGGVCWELVTPDILPGDQVRVTYRATLNNANIPGLVPNSGYVMNVQNVKAVQAVVVGETVVIKGVGLVGTSAFPAARMEVRIIQPDFVGTRIGRRDIRADITGGRLGDLGTTAAARGILTLDVGSLVVGAYTAVFTGLNAAERALAVAGETRVLSWQTIDAVGNRLGITIYEVGLVGGPGFGGCPCGPLGCTAAFDPLLPVPYNPATLLDAALVENQPFLKDIIVFPERDFVSISGGLVGFAAGTLLQVVVRRNIPADGGMRIVGTATGTTDPTGFLEINHPGGVCWSGVTPDIRPGDWIDVFPVVLGVAGPGQTQQVVDTIITRAAFSTPQGVRVNWQARDAAGFPWPLDKMEQRIINPAFVDTAIGRRDIRADVGGGTIAAVPNTNFLYGIDPGLLGSSYRSIYRGIGFTAEMQQFAVAGESRVLAWQSVDANGNRYGLTIYESGVFGGPGFGGCPVSGTVSLPFPALPP
jgi:hypothetical protein